MRIFCLIGVFFALVLSALAQNYSQTGNGASVNVTYTVTGNTVAYSYSAVGSSAGGGTNIALYLVPCNLAGVYLGSGAITVAQGLSTTPSSGAGSRTIAANTGFYWASSWASAQQPAGVSLPIGTPFFANPKKVKVSYFNSKDYPVTIKLVGDPSGQTLAQTVVPANSGFIQEVSLPFGDQNAILFVEVSGVMHDGRNWVEAPGAVASIKAATLPGSTSSPTPTTNVPQPSNMPSAPSGDPLNPPSPPVPDQNNPPRPEPPKPIWKPDPPDNPALVDNERLDKDTYREGVGKVTDSVARVEKIIGQIADNKGDETVPDAYTPEAQGTTTMPKPTNLIPTAPQFFSGSFGSVTSVSATLPSFTILGKTWPQYSYEYDFSKHATPIAFFRALLVVVITVSFFIRCVQTIKGAVASEK